LDINLIAMTDFSMRIRASVREVMGKEAMMNRKTIERPLQQPTKKVHLSPLLSALSRREWPLILLTRLAPQPLSCGPGRIPC
jgi:hypothetical protein